MRKRREHAPALHFAVRCISMPPHVDACIRLQHIRAVRHSGAHRHPGLRTMRCKKHEKGAILAHGSSWVGGPGWGVRIPHGS
eukprot:8484305-Alexandrium_andersonii.AAC.1